MPVHDWSQDPPVPHESFHAAWIIEIVRALNRRLLPQGFRAYAERHLGILQPDVTTYDESAARRSRRRERAGPQGWEATAVLEYDPTPKRYAARVDKGDGKAVAFLELVSESNKASPAACETFVEHLSVHIADGLHLVLVDVFAVPAANLHRKLTAHLEVVAGRGTRAAGTLYVCSYRNLGPGPDDGRGQLEACYKGFDIGQPLPAGTLWLSAERWVKLDLEHLYRETCTTMRIA